MKQKLFSILALLLVAVSGAWAQEPATYKITVAEGTEDVGKWNVPTEAAEGSPVTATYSGEKKVKSVKAVKKEVAKPDLLPAVFTVDAGKKVKFSKGNLQATYNGSSWIWGFAEHQWDYIGNAAGNTSINGNGTVSANGTVDLFGWVGASSTWTGAAIYGISNSTTTNSVDGYGNVASEALNADWGTTIGAGWRTLTKDEWLYLLNTRETGATVNSTDHARRTHAVINTDGTAVKGLIIFPDGYVGGTPAGVTWGTINEKSDFTTTCTSAGWTALEAAGCVFLPAAGYREASNVTDAGIGGGYWSSSSGYAASAFGLYFESDYMTIQYGGSRKYGFSVRPVQEVAPTYTLLSTITSDYTAQDGDILTGTLGSNVKISIADGAKVTLKDVTINGVNNPDYGWAGITCAGDATITLEGANTLKGFNQEYPGIYVPEGKTLTIEGEGSLNASGNGRSTGIGGGYYKNCGDIVINGGNITATGGSYNAGIGGGEGGNCGAITINGGTVTATGGGYAAGIGGGNDANCGNITISGGNVTATGGQFAAGIGGGKRGFGTSICGNITISGGTITATGGENAAGIGGGKGRNNSNPSSCGTITITSGVTSVTATKGSSAENSIGAGSFGTCGAVTIEDPSKVTQK